MHMQTCNAGEERDCSPPVKPCAAVAAVPALHNLSLPFRCELHPPRMQNGIAVPALLKTFFLIFGKPVTRHQPTAVNQQVQGCPAF